MTRFATVSKYPPYISGHSHQAFWLNRELALALGAPAHQISYCGAVPAWYTDGSVRVHEVLPSPIGNRKVVDGHLLKALAARATRLVAEHGVTHLLALYADPHAEVVARAARTSRLLGHPVHVAVSVEGSDITSSLARHTGDGEAAVLLGDIIMADTVMAVSRRAREVLLDVSSQVLPAPAVEGLADRVVIRYPGLPPESFRRPDPRSLAHWRSRHGWRPGQQLISTFVRLVPEKGLDKILQIAEAARGRDDLAFAIAGSGPLRDALAERLRARGLTSVQLLGDLDPEQAQLLRAASSVALFPSRQSSDWEETFGIAAIEYQALGVPVLASDSPGFAESCAVPLFRMPLAAGAPAWLARLDDILAGLPRCSAVASTFARSFTSRSSVEVLLDAVAPARSPSLAVRR